MRTQGTQLVQPRLCHIIELCKPSENEWTRNPHYDACWDAESFVGRIGRSAVKTSHPRRVAEGTLLRYNCLLGMRLRAT